ncbi:hypothetical protein C8R45DRAFT_1159957, partial [Mycena sanguinolenta]
FQTATHDDLRPCNALRPQDEWSERIHSFSSWMNRADRCTDFYFRFPCFSRSFRFLWRSCTFLHSPSISARGLTRRQPSTINFWPLQGRRPCAPRALSLLVSLLVRHGVRLRASHPLSPRAPRPLCGMRPHRRRLLESAETFLPVRLRFSAAAMTETRSTQAPRARDRRGGRLDCAAGGRSESDYAWGERGRHGSTSTYSLQDSRSDKCSSSSQFPLSFSALE